MGDAWEWELADGEKITAKLELPSRIESVWLGARLVSRSKAGGKGEAHIVRLPSALKPPSSGSGSGGGSLGASSPPPNVNAAEVYRVPPLPREADVSFDPALPQCTLRIDGAVIMPTRQPDAEALLPPPAIPRRILGMPIGRFAIVAGVSISLAIIAVVPPTIRSLRNRTIRAKIANAPALRARSEVTTAPDQSISAHYPTDFDPVVDAEGAVISLHRPKKLEMIVLISQPRTDLDDAADLDRIMMKGLSAFASKSGATMSTTITHEGDCHEFPGVISTSTLSTPDKDGDIPQKVVGCSALRNGRSYFFAYFVPEFIAEKEEPELVRIINATDIFDMPTLAELDPRGNTFGTINGNSFGTDFDPRRTGPVVFPTQNGRFSVIPNGAPAQRGFVSAPRPALTVRQPSPPPPRAPTSSPGTPLQFNANGSVEYSGNAADKAAAMQRERRAAENRARVPW